jgi:hypothetical protein
MVVVIGIPLVIEVVGNRVKVGLPMPLGLPVLSTLATAPQAAMEARRRRQRLHRLLRHPSWN